MAKMRACSDKLRLIKAIISLKHFWREYINDFSSFDFAWALRARQIHHRTILDLTREVLPETAKVIDMLASAIRGFVQLIVAKIVEAYCTPTSPAFQYPGSLRKHLRSSSLSRSTSAPSTLRHHAGKM
jgi:hypothetical protein